MMLFMFQIDPFRNIDRTYFGALTASDLGITREASQCLAELDSIPELRYSYLQEPLAKLLIATNPELINKTNHEGRTAIHISVLKNDWQTLHWLLNAHKLHPDANPSPCTQDKYGNTPIDYAFNQNNIYLIQEFTTFLIERKLLPKKVRV